MAKLTTRQRNKLHKTTFALPSQRKYPINDKTHARLALAMVAAHGTAYEKRLVKAAVHRKFPTIGQGTTKRSTRRKRK